MFSYYNIFNFLSSTKNLGSQSLSFPECVDDIRFAFDGKKLTVVSRKGNEEKLSFFITSQRNEIINKVNHTVLSTNDGCEFYIVNNKFHREDDKPAIIMKRWGFNYKLNNPDSLNVKCKIWMKNGRYHRPDNKYAVFFENGVKLWFENGLIKRCSPMEDAQCVY